MNRSAAERSSSLRLVSLRRLEELLGRGRKDLFRIAEQAGRYYRPFDRRRERGSGKWRHIDNPTGELKRLQSKIQRRILSEASLPDSMLGCVPGKSIRDNALQHLRSPMLVTMDLRNCFPRIHDLDVFRTLKSELGIATEIAGVLTKLLTVQHRLPQGAPSSPALCNLVLLPMHMEIRNLASGMELQVTQYVDDIAISGARALEAIDPVIRIIQRQGHSAPRRKIHRLPNSASQRLTGTVVNRALSVGTTRLRRVRQRIYQLAFLPEIADWKLKSVRGQIASVRQISPTQGMALERLAERLLPEVGVGGRRVRTDETRPCNSTARHAVR